MEAAYWPDKSAWWQIRTSLMDLFSSRTDLVRDTSVLKIEWTTGFDFSSFKLPRIDPYYRHEYKYVELIPNCLQVGPQGKVSSRPSTTCVDPPWASREDDLGESMPKFRRGACRHIQTIRSHLLGRLCIYLCKESVGGETLPGAVDLWFNEYGNFKRLLFPLE